MYPSVLPIFCRFSSQGGKRFMKLERGKGEGGKKRRG